MRHKIFSLLLLTLINSATIFGQIVSSNGWYFQKTPMSNVFGLPFIFESSKKEATVGSSTPLSVDSSKDLTVNEGFNYSKIFESSWREILLGSLYKNNKNIQLTVESWGAKRWVFNRNRFKDFDLNTFYPVEGISADTLKITCKVFNKSDWDSKAVENILKEYLKGNTVAFKIIEGLSSTKSDTLKGLFHLTKKDSSEFNITIKKSNVLYALKFGKLKTRGKPYFFVQDSYKNEKQIPMATNIRKTILNYPYKPDKNSGIVNVYVDLVRQNITDKAPRLIIYNLSAKDTIELKDGTDIGDGLLHYEGEAIYKKGYGGNKNLQVNFCYDFDYDTKRNVILIKGFDKSIGEFLNCIYRMDTIFEVLP